MNSLSAQKVAGVTEGITAKRAQLFHFTPLLAGYESIETDLAKLKAFLGRNHARSVDALWHRVGELPRRFSIAGCVNYSQAARYQRSM